MATVELLGLSKAYGDVEAVADLELSIGDGEFFVVLGPSGAGKTTTLKSVAGLVEVDRGDVVIAGRSMRGVEPYHRNVAMAFESYALYPQKTVFENLASPLRSGRTGRYSASDQQQRIDAVTTTLGINHLLKRFPRELSNGQRQRVALGRVLVRPADVYLLDEPLSHLDAKLRAQMRAELKQLGEMSNTTSLYVTHDYQEALALGDRIAVLRHGRLVQVGTPHEIWRTPVDSFVAKALGQPEINIVDAEVADGRLRAAGGAIDLPAPQHLDLAGGRARLGFRPRDLGLVRAGATAPAGDVVLRGRVGLAERLGRLMEFSVDVGGTDVIVVADSDAGAREGDVVDLHVPLTDVHVFAAGPAEEDTLRLGGAAVREPAQERS
ncbi:ABC transporter ATP-binding protein [Kineococcus rubinsiae]|uniref:ABC transporter ATP-binding protein n=1 Tax=Kineococcus rubinsiae TaxID=2609562 RepID=UPI00142FFF74|nr:ABC transporter ATP-binding protein [Kineococcus rubinsiae]NIZ93251.1 ABC transporter ATP-binding protein [Kineococcus rubinsiae]